MVDRDIPFHLSISHVFPPHRGVIQVIMISLFVSKPD